MCLQNSLPGRTPFSRALTCLKQAHFKHRFLCCSSSPARQALIFFGDARYVSYLSQTCFKTACLMSLPLGGAYQLLNELHYQFRCSAAAPAVIHMM